MKILALEFSSDRRSVAVLEAPGKGTGPAAQDTHGEGAGEGIVGRGWNASLPIVMGSAVETEGRSVKALGLIRAALQQAGLEPAQIEVIAVGLGPGSYTGIRAAISIAQGWQLALPVKLLGVSSVECIAAQMHKEQTADYADIRRYLEEKRQRAAALQDAGALEGAPIQVHEHNEHSNKGSDEGRMGRGGTRPYPGEGKEIGRGGTRPYPGEGKEIGRGGTRPYQHVVVLVDAQRNEFYLAEYEMLAGEARIVEPLRLAALAEVQARVERGETCVGPELSRWFPGARVVYPEAEMLGVLASARSDFVTGDKLVPIYLRETAFVKAPPARVIE